MLLSCVAEYGWVVLLGESDFNHGLRGYKKYKCRCNICSEEYFQAKVRENIKNRKALIKHYMIAAEPLIALYKETIGRLNANQRRLVSKWETNGISVYDADVYSIRLGYHPYEIFGESYFEGLQEEIAEYKKMYGEEADV
jgi:hypothetical protein